MAVQTKPRELHVSYTDLSSVEPGLLARAVVSLEEVNIRSTELTDQQVEHILAAVGKDSRLKKFDLGDNISLKFMDPNLLATAVNMLEEVNIDCVWIKQPQLEALFTSFREQTKLKTLKIGFNSNMKFYRSVTQMRVVEIHAKVAVTLAEVKRETVLEAESLRIIDQAFCFGHFQISLEQGRFKMIKTNDRFS